MLLAAKQNKMKTSLFILTSLLIAVFVVDCSAVWVDSYINRIDTAGVESILVKTYRFDDGWQAVDLLTARFSDEGLLEEETRNDASGVLAYELSLIHI